MHKTILLVLAVVSLVAGCGSNKPQNEGDHSREENAEAKKLLQGVWIDEDEEDVFFRAKGDTIYYPDSTSEPTYFRIVHDTLYMEGANVVKYPIVKQAAHIFQFKNQGGDIIKLVKSSDPHDLDIFRQAKKSSINQNQLIKRDSVVEFGASRYHWYVQVNPTTYKVYNSSFNEDGVEVDNVFYDNIIHVSLFNGATQIFSRDFRKQDFKNNVPEAFLKQSVLSDINYKSTDASGMHFLADIEKPGSYSSYLVELIISYDGKMRLKIEE